MVTEYRNIDGTGNNLTNTEWGSAGSRFLRTTPSDYADGISAMAGADRPSARHISNETARQTGDEPNSYGASDYLWVWGQFLDHDIDLTRESHAPEFAPIAIPTGDPSFDPAGTGTQTMPFGRSGYDPATGATGPREQMNDITAFIDASMVYGSDAEKAAALRTDGGYLKMGDGNLLPTNDGSFPEAGPGGGDTFLAGDVRANENVGLTSMHTIFAREHNRLVDELKAENPDWSDEQLYQEAKAIVEGEIQAITYNEFLPLLLGQDALAAYDGYKAEVDPQIANIFATAAFRFGHSMLSSTIHRVGEDGSESQYGHLDLRDAFFRPDRLVNEGGVDDTLRGLAVGTSQTIDTHLIEDVRSFLFGPPGSGGMDLEALNIQRGRDHGLPDYNTAREAYGLARVTSFSEITSDTEIAGKLEALFGTVDNIDVFVGGLAEDEYGDSMLGELFTTIIAEQFTRLRDGDRFFYENRFDGEELAYLQNVTLSQIIQQNTDIGHLQDDVFHAYNRIGGTDDHDVLAGTEGRDLIFGLNGEDILYGGDGHDQLKGDAGHDEMYGGKGDDILYGGAGDDWLIGAAGNDTLKGEDGHDYLHGGRGDDTLLGGAGHDDLIGGNGNDFADGGDGHDDIRGGQGDDDLYGGAGHDEIRGGAGDDILVGEAGNDLLRGGNGDDLLEGGAGLDELFGGNGNDDLVGGADHDLLKGGRGDDVLLGGDGHDELFGGSGQDILVGGAGSDVMVGGRGSDTFAFDAAFGDDLIKDFRTGPNLDVADVLDFSGTGLSYLDLTIEDTGNSTLITAGDLGTVELSGVNAADLSVDAHFLFSAPAAALDPLATTSEAPVVT